MRQNLRQQPSTSQNLDSFLDILTNTVGVLMFIGLFISLVSVESSNTIRTPLASTTNKKAYYLEVRNNIVVDWNRNIEVAERDLEKRLHELKKLSLQSCEGLQSSSEEFKDCINKNVRKLSNFRIKAPDYNVSIAPNLNGLFFESLRINSKNTSKKLNQDYSQLQKVFDKLDSKATYLVFLVRSDAFPVFRRVRELAWSKKFDVGWEPIVTDGHLLYDYSGKTEKILPQ